MRQYTLEEIKAVVPQKMKPYVSKNVVDLVNNPGGDEAEDFNENFLSFISVCKDSSGTIKDYINAVRFCTLKMRGNTDIDSWKITFPEKYLGLNKRGLTDTEIGAWVRAYKQKKLVVNILQHAIVPVQITHYHLMHKALEALGKELEHSKGMVRVKAAEALLNVLKPQDTQKMQIQIGVNGGDKLAELATLVDRLVTTERAMLSSGVASLDEVIGRNILPEYVDAEVQREAA